MPHVFNIGSLYGRENGELTEFNILMGSEGGSGECGSGGSSIPDANKFGFAEINNGVIYFYADNTKTKLIGQISLPSDNDTKYTFTLNGTTLRIEGTDGTVKSIVLPSSGESAGYDDSELVSRIQAIENKQGTWDAKSDFSGNYNDLTNKPTIPTVPTSEISANTAARHTHSNKAVLDGITASKVQEWNNKSNFSGNYNDLTNKPDIPEIPPIPTVTNDFTDAYKNRLDQLTDDYIKDLIGDVAPAIPDGNGVKY